MRYAAFAHVWRAFVYRCAFATVFLLTTTCGRGQDTAQALNGNLLAAKAFHVAAKRVLPSIVTIETYGGVATGARRGAYRRN